MSGTGNPSRERSASGAREPQTSADVPQHDESPNSGQRRRRGLLSRMLIGLVRGYQMIVSPWFAPRCRYYPSCSQYAIDAMGKHGVIKGTALATWRLLRCNPWSLGGVDHVPEHFGARRTLIGSSPASSPRSASSRGDRDQM